MDYKSKLKKVMDSVSEGKILLVVPPFSLIDFPCIGLDILQSIANDEGIKTSVLYANMLFAQFIGVDKYKHISNSLMSLHTMLGERLFTNAAYPSMPLLGKNFLEEDDINFTDKFSSSFTYDQIQSIASMAIEWTDMLAAEIVEQNYVIVGVTTGHQQTNATIALINRIKKLNPHIICTVGGSSCDGEMAEGVLSLSPNIDYAFSGESEISWRNFLHQYIRQELPKNRLIRDKFLDNLDELIANDNTYKDYFKQMEMLDINEEISMLYESSRGCWWGEHNKCTFCGVNGWNKHYRFKSADKVLSDITTILKAHPQITHIQMVDTLMPRHYFKKLVPALSEKFPHIDIFYEQRADLTLGEVLDLKLSVVNYTQVGIEALSTGLLKLINKGITAEQNIRFLRYARSVGLLIGWNLLTEIPNDTEEQWNQALDLIPAICHLNPPLLIRPVEIARFSPYFENPTQYGIRNMEADKVYSDIYPSNAAVDQLAWMFSATFDSDSKDSTTLNKRINEIVSTWMNKWRQTTHIPYLKIVNRRGAYYLLDSRYDAPSEEKLTDNQARIALFGLDNKVNDSDVSWGISKKVLLPVDGKLIPLATAHPRIYKELSNE